MSFEWELIFKSEDKITETWRAKVIGGWLVRDFNCIYTDSNESLGGTGMELKTSTRRYSSCVGLAFVPDQNHEWSIE